MHWRAPWPTRRRVRADAREPEPCMPWISWERSAIACRRDTRDRDAHDDDMHYGLWRTVFSSFAVRIEQMKLSGQESKSVRVYVAAENRACERNGAVEEDEENG